MEFSKPNQAIGFSTRQVSSSITSDASVPSLIERAGHDTKRRFVEFFTAQIRNKHTRRAYFRAVDRFCRWLEDHRVDRLQDVEPTMIAFYIEEMQDGYSKASIKQHLAAIRMLFDYFVTGGLIRNNPALSVRGPRLTVIKGKTPVLQPQDARHLLDSITTDTIGGLRDKALISLMLYTFARIGAVVSMNVDDVYQNGRRYWVRLQEKNGRQHEMPLNHHAEEAMIDYLDGGNLWDQKGVPLFRSLDRHRNLSETRMRTEYARWMIKRRSRAAGLGDNICNHTMRATGITAYMMAGGTLEKAQQMAAHASSKTTNLYNRANDSVTLDEVERILI